FDLVERAHKVRQKRADETTTETIARGDREIEGRSATCSRRARAPKAAAFDDLPSQERGNAHRQIANPRDQGNRKGGLAWNAEKITDKKITALLHAQRAGNRKCGRANSHGHALEDER